MSSLCSAPEFGLRAWALYSNSPADGFICAHASEGLF